MSGKSSGSLATVVGTACWRWMACALALVWLGLFLVRATAPSDFMDNSQDRQAGYVQDLLCNGNIACQLDQNGVLCAKPPLYTWLAGACSLPWGRTTELGLQLPNSLAILACVLMLWGVGRWRFGAWAGFFAAVMFLVSPGGLRWIFLARTDGLYMLLVAGAAVAAFRAWTGAVRGWGWFWLLAALATLTKGPQGLLPVGAALAACSWMERREPEKLPSGGGRWWPGLLLFLALCGGWLAWAYADFGAAVFHKMFGEELVGHALNSKGRGEPLWQTFHKPALALFQRFAPWSLLTLAGLWAVFRRPAVEAGARRLERFLAWYLLSGLLMFSLASHKRQDLISPLVPAAAWLAGREAARWMERLRWRPRVVLAVAAAGWAVLAAACFSYYHFLPSRNSQKEVVQTQALRLMAAEFEARFGRECPVLYPLEGGAAARGQQAFQFFLGTMCRSVPMAEAVRAFSGEKPAVAAVTNAGAFQAAVGAAGGKCYARVSWSGVRELPAASGKTLEPVVMLSIVANMPAGELGRSGCRESCAGGQPTGMKRN